MGRITDQLLGSSGTGFGQQQQQQQQPAYSGRLTNQLLGVPKIQPVQMVGGGMQEVPVRTEQQPTGGISTITGQPITRFIDPISKPAKESKFDALFKAAFVDDPQTKIKIFAASRFPDIPLEQAVQKYGIKDGEILFRDDDGVFKKETGATFKSNAMKLAADTGATAPSIILGAIGAGLGGIPGAALGAASGEAIRKMIGALAFDEPQTNLENALDIGTEMLLGVTGEAGSRVFSGAVNKTLGAGRPKGRKLARLAEKDLRFATKTEKAAMQKGDIGITPVIDAAEAERLKALGKRHGIDLATPEISGNKELINRMNLLGDLSQSADLIAEFKRTQNLQIQNAVPNFLDTIAKEADPFEVGADIVMAADDAILGLKGRRAASARPFYKKAFQEAKLIDKDLLAAELKRNASAIKSFENVKDTVDLDKMVSALNQRGVPADQVAKEGPKAYERRITGDFKRIIKEDVPMISAADNTDAVNKLTARNDAIRRALKGDIPEGFVTPEKRILVDTNPAIEEIDNILKGLPSEGPSVSAVKTIKRIIVDAKGDLQILDRIKRESIDEILDKNRATPALKREMAIIKDSLIEEMETVSPSYGLARFVHGLHSTPVEQAEKGLVGQLARMNSDNIAGASTQILASKNSSPQLVRRAKFLIESQDKEAWDAGVRDFIRNRFEEIMQDEQVSEVSNIGGALRKAVFGSKNQRDIMKAAMSKEQFQNMTDFMEVLQRTGLTFGKEATTAIRQLELARLDRELTGVVGQVAETMTTPFQTPRRLFVDKMNELRYGRGARELAELILDPEAGKQLKKIKRLSPRSDLLIRQLGVFMGLEAPAVREAYQGIQGMQQGQGAGTIQAPQAPGLNTGNPTLNPRNSLNGNGHPGPFRTNQSI